MRKYISAFLLLLAFLVASQAAQQENGEAEPVTMTSPFQPQYSANSQPQTSLDHIADLIGLTAYQKSYQTDGTGMTIALIDSGIDLKHPDFQPNTDGSSKVVIYHDFTSESEDSGDTLGHGTFLAGIVAANGENYHGLAPNARLAVYKIFDSEGKSSQHLLAKAIEQAVADKVDLINLSLSIPHEEYRLPRLAAALKQAKEKQIPIVAAVGNYGPAAGTIAYPADDAYVIAIGSYQEPKMMEQDLGILLERPFVTAYSARDDIEQPRNNFFVAPAAVISTVPTWFAEDYLYDEGTSISAAIVSGALLNFLQHEQANYQTIINKLQQWSKDLGLSPHEQGKGAVYLNSLSTTVASTDYVNTSSTQKTPYLRQLNLLNPQSIYFSLPQGQTQTVYLQVPSDKKEMQITVALLRQEAQNQQEHSIALGRCRVMLFDPKGNLVASPSSIGATYSEEMTTSVEIAVPITSSGRWQLTITSDPYLSQYNHLTTQGWLNINAL